MSEDIYAKPDLTKKVRFQADEKKDRNTDVGDNNDKVVIYDNYRAEGSSPPKSQDNTTEEQQQTTSVSVSSEKRTLLRVAVAVFLGLLCLLLLAAISGIIILIQVKNNLNVARNQLLVDNHNLTRERDKLESINRNLTQKTIQLEDKINLLNTINNNLTTERDELQKYIEKTCCPANWMKFSRSCYLISTTMANWDGSKAFCESHDAQLVIISSFEEQRFISSFDLNFWIGLTDKEEEGEWIWVNGTAAYTKYWRTNQPDNARGSEDCAQILKGYSVTENWNDIPCIQVFNFVCEKMLQ
ncbi:asialoglycoprotein receptor 1-like isoform X2 [Dicentrarchus labrax]|uniref:asialoglycoprotein receptor 1-like isoform X2 n=1 Tax=Dicentrarchus labrax TaxID=13489 RepID=UPI0021F5A979|nr:asialoglycoprotein receptor 1-like isoform X2 [Dicentrarchus labrax]